MRTHFVICPRLFELKQRHVSEDFKRVFVVFAWNGILWVFVSVVILLLCWSLAHFTISHVLVEQLPWSNSKTSACCFSLLMFLHKPCIEVSESKFTLVVFKETIQWWTWINQTLLAIEDKNGVVIRLTASSLCKCRFARRFNQRFSRFIRYFWK